MKNKPLILILLILFIRNSFLMADDAPISFIPGGTVKPINNDDIKLVKETIDFLLYSDYYIVEVNYLFHNTGKSQEIALGFPSSTSEGYGVQDFKAFENDSIKFIYKKKGIWNTTISLNNIGYELDEFECFDTKFDSGEYIRIKNIYKQKYNCFSYCFGSKFSYVLSTGSLWKGSIDSLTIRVNANVWKQDNNIDKVKYTFLTDETVDLRNFQRVYTNIEPTKDFEFTILDYNDFYLHKTTEEKDGGIGEKVSYISNKMHNSPEPFVIDSIAIYNGNQKGLNLFYQNNRVKKIKVTFSNDYGNEDRISLYYDLKDTNIVQYLKTPDKINASYVEIEILDIYKGSNNKGISLPGVEFFVKQIIEDY